MKKKLGYLNFPKIESERFSFSHDIQTKVHLQYAELIKSTEIGQQIIKILKDDSRVKSLDEYMIFNGSGAQRFELKTFAMWYLWAINEFGQKKAEKYLNEFLDSFEITVINTLWVLGVEVDERIKLKNGVIIMPISEMPDSREKENYMKYFNGEIYQQPKPKVALIFETKVVKSFKDNDPLDSFDRDNTFLESSRLLHDVALILNLINGISCIPYFSTSYVFPQSPLGLFSGSGGGGSVYDVIGHGISKLKISQVNEINKIIKCFITLPEKEKTRFERAISRLSQSKRRMQIEDKMLDLGIALEMVLLEDNENNNQLSLAFRLRGSWLIADNEANKLAVYKKLKSIYNYRSQIAHSGVLRKNDEKGIQKVREEYSDFSEVAEKVIKKLIYGGRPDWSKVILGIDR